MCQTSGRRISRRRRGTIAFLGTTLCVALLAVPAAALTPQHETQLSQALETISGGYNQSAYITADSILFSTAYSAGDLEAFFNLYFVTGQRMFTDQLAVYLNNSAFLWGTEANQLKLQQALVTPLWNRITALTAAHPADLGPAAYTDTGLRQSLFNGHKFYAMLAKDGAVETSVRQTIETRYKAYINANPQYFKDTYLNPSLQPFVPELRGQVWISYTETLPLTDARRIEIADTIALAGPNGKKRALWNSNSIMVVDNGGYGEGYLDIMQETLDSIPRALLNPSLPGNLRYVYDRAAFQTTPGVESLLGRGALGRLNFRIAKVGGGVYFQLVTSAGLETAAGGSLPSDSWNHVVATRNGSTLSVYVNGSLVASGTLAGTVDAGGEQQLFLGSDPNYNDEFKGRLDKVRLYSRALSAAEVSSSYAGAAVSSTGLAAAYDMNEATGTAVADSSGNGNNGVRQGATIVAGQAGNGLQFDGIDDKVAVPSSASLALGGNFTLETWVYWVAETVWPHNGNADSVNLMLPEIGEPSNEFPDDIAPMTMDSFTSVAVHEFNHSVNFFCVQGDPVNNARLNRLIQQAGTTTLQYLRSQILVHNSPAYFQTYPHELFASLSQQYFCNTAYMLRLALQRFDAGYHEPLNQFLLFADVYSLGGNSTLFYRIDTTPTFTRTSKPIRRSATGGIRLLAADGYRYRFTLDALDNVTAYDKAVDTDSDGLSDAEETALGTASANADTDGDGLSDLDEVWYDGDEAYNPYHPSTNPGGTDLDAGNVDSDGDGLRDGWEAGYTLDPLDPTGTNGADGDPDGDGYTNSDEQAGDTDPRDNSDIPVAMPVSAPWALAVTLLLLLATGTACRRRRA